MDNISKIEVNGSVYEVKDGYARQNLHGYIPKNDVVFEGSIKEDGSTYTGAEKAAALGNNTAATGNYSATFGDSTIASGKAAIAAGDHVSATGNGAHAEGIGIQDPNTLSWTNSLASGEAAHVEGKGTTASGNHSHAEGCETAATGHASHAQGCNTAAAASYSHVEGHNNVILSTVDQDGFNETGVAAHVEGANNETRASYSHVEGYGNRVGIDAQYAHVSGHNNNAMYPNNKIVVGFYNENRPEDILEIGTGYLDTSGSTDVEVRKTPIRLTNQNVLNLTLEDVLFNTIVDGNNKTFSLINAAIVDDELSSTSTHPVQNKVIQEQLSELFQSVSEGKKLLTDALADLGVLVPGDNPSFSDIADGIRSINPGYEVDTKYLFVRTSKYTTEDGDIYPIPMPIEGSGDGSFINFYTVDIQNE